MASKNSVKVYIPNSFYHVYNRGVEQRKIFLDPQDYFVFLSYIETYLLPKDQKSLYAILLSQDSSQQEKDKALKLLKLKNYNSQILLICYALMPNHFHLLIRQNDPILNSFMNSLGTRYAMYFNRKYRRKGVLFQDVYKAVLVETDEQLIHLSRYIHLNPIEALNLPVSNWKDVQLPSSLPEFFGERKTEWISKEYILDFFSKMNSYNSYEEFMGLPQDLERISNIAIDFEND